MLAADGPGLVTARRAASGSWAIQQLGAGAQPQLAAGPAGSLLLLSAPADTVAHGQARQGPALRVLPRGGAWGAPLALAAAGQAIAGLALAVDPRTGAVHAAIQDGPVSRRRASLDPAMHLAALNLAPGGHLSVVPGSVRLNPPQPAPGARAALLVAVRNTGVTTRAAGSAALVRLSPGGTAIRLRTGAPLAPGATTTLRAMLIVPAAALQVVASAGGVAERATLALPPAPSGLGMTPRASDHAVQLQWAPAPDRDIVSYRIYRGIGRRGPLSLAGIATGMLWQDSQREGGAVSLPGYGGGSLRARIAAVVAAAGARVVRYGVQKGITG